MANFLAFAVLNNGRNQLIGNRAPQVGAFNELEDVAKKHCLTHNRTVIIVRGGVILWRGSKSPPGMIYRISGGLTNAWSNDNLRRKYFGDYSW